MAEVTLTKENFDEVVLKAEVPVMVDFWAPWCGPCRMVGPIVAQIAEEQDGKVIVGKVNVDEEEDIAMAFKVEAIPTLLLYMNGKQVSKKVGYMSLEDIRLWVKSYEG